MSFTLQGRPLFITNNLQKLRAQLRGETLTLETAGELRREISTDEIIPVPKMTFFDERLVRFALTGLKIVGALPVQAGICQVIAESFERIYRQNAENIGMLTSTNMRLIDRLQAGEVISIEESLNDRDALTG